MDAPLAAPDALIRPWRTATLVASLVAAIELVLLARRRLPPAREAARARDAAARGRARSRRRRSNARRHAQAGAASRCRSCSARRRASSCLTATAGGAASTEAARLSTSATACPGREREAPGLRDDGRHVQAGFHAEGIRLARDLHVKSSGRSTACRRQRCTVRSWRSCSARVASALRLARVTSSAPRCRHRRRARPRLVVQLCELLEVVVRGAHAAVRVGELSRQQPRVGVLRLLAVASS